MLLFSLMATNSWFQKLIQPNANNYYNHLLENSCKDKHNFLHLILIPDFIFFYSLSLRLQWDITRVSGNQHGLVHDADPSMCILLLLYLMKVVPRPVIYPLFDLTHSMVSNRKEPWICTKTKIGAYWLASGFSRFKGTRHCPLHPCAL